MTVDDSEEEYNENDEITVKNVQDMIRTLEREKRVDHKAYQTNY